ncbi:MAG: DUF5916 domain-containing protein [Bacteroidota bacterium]
MKKEIEALRIADKIKIDGYLDESIWEQAKVASDFTTFEPDPGEEPLYDTEVKMLYDDEAIYLGVFMKDEYPDSILKELTLRDDIGNTDFFAVSFDYYRSGLSGLEFGVTASGVQFDINWSDGPDNGWDAVWLSEARIGSDGWYVEMKIPFSAMRFADAEEQIWYVNFSRNIRRTREQSWWQEMDPADPNWFAQYGLTKGIKDIKTPTRLFFFPYLSYYVEHAPDGDDGSSSWARSINGGMDVKYGINDAFTLDLTLIPDFGQVVSDNQVLNLSPFEIQFAENRQFFTEGTDLFNKANIFYSRRIGGTPQLFWDVEDHLNDTDSILSNPATSQLINAAKVSGRNQQGLGIGVFNAVTSETKARIFDEESGEERDFVTDPLTNYNVLVFDQNLWTNASVAVINTNVTRNGSFYDANATGTEFRLPDKENNWVLSGSSVLSQRYFSDSTELGTRLEYSLDKISGKSNYGASFNRIGRDYNVNDLGINFRTNFTSYSAFYSWRTLEPVGKFNRLRFNLFSFYQRNNEPNRFADFAINWWSFALTKGFTAFGLNGRFEPVNTFDFFEPRVFGRYYEYPRNWRIGGFVSSDYRKTFAGDIEWGTRHFNEPGRYNTYFELRPRLRVSDQFFVRGSYSVFKQFNDVGWAEEWNDDIVFGIRDRVDRETTLRARYIFSPLMGVNLIGRYYWGTVKYDSFHSLTDDGGLGYTDYTGIDEYGVSLENNNFNAFTIDAQFTWWFAPGSSMTAAWKNNIFTSDPELQRNYFDNLSQVLQSDQLNSFSIRVLYFLDYNQLRKKA